MEENSSISSSEASSDRSNQPDPAAITGQVWEIAEEAAWREVISCIHPTLDSEEKRKDVIDFVQRTIRRALKVEVFPYGSVPLKTYLPDGDIDLTALNIPKTDDSLSRDVLSVMHAEQLNANAEYEVRDTQFIDAEVKLVKCLVQNIVIDISFNQLGGLSTLCFLEQVDRLIAKDHLFKHSIILIKAWCFYESRILGAHHGLISTYALESLVLYIFNMFNSSLTGPLAVLYRFLVYYSKFDWENYCISLNGPVLISYLPDLVVANPENDDDLMLSEEFLRNCVDMFSVTSKSPDTNLRTFPKKNLNIIDPLKPNNNLGRSVNRGNYFRIRSAFKFGARKLGNILMLPRDRIVDEIKNFFENTLERHRHKNASNISGDELGRLPLSAYSNDDMQLNHSNRNIDDHVLGMEDKSRPASRNELESYSINTVYSQMVQTCYTTKETGFAEDRFGKEYNDSTYRSLHLQDTNGEPDFSSPRRDYSDSYMMKFHAGGSNNSVISGPDDTLSDCLSLDFKEKSIDSIAEDIDSLCLSDLSGDYDSHVRSLLYGQCCHGTALSAPAKCNPPPSSPSFHVNNRPWDTVRQYLPLIWKTNSYGAAFGHQPYPVDMSNPSTASFGLVERRKARGTGTYIPNPERNSVRDRPSQARRIQGQETGCHVQKNISNSGADSSSPRTNAIKEDEHKLVKEHSLVSDCQKQDLPRQPARAKSIHSQGNGIPVSNRKLEFGSFKSKTEGSSSLGSSNSSRGASASSSAAPKVQNSKEGKSKRQARVAEKSLNLNNDDDFPPLSS